LQDPGSSFMNYGWGARCYSGTGAEKETNLRTGLSKLSFGATDGRKAMARYEEKEKCKTKRVSDSAVI